MDRVFLDYYEEELQHIRSLATEFAALHPNVARNLSLDSVPCPDPYVERLLEGVAYLAARTRLKIDAESSRYVRDLLDAQAPLVLVFMANFGHPITRTFASRYADTYTSLHDGGFALVVRSRADKLARSIGPDTLPYPLLCDAAGVLYEHLSIPTSKSTLMSYSLEGWRILREAKKQGYQPVKGAEQQLPLTLILDRDGTVLFCHYGASLTDVPEDCAAIQSLLEEMELTPGLEPEEDELPYEELQTAVAAESRPRSRHGRERPETTDEFRPIRPVRAYPESDLEKTSMFGLFDDPYDDK